VGEGGKRLQWRRRSGEGVPFRDGRPPEFADGEAEAASASRRFGKRGGCGYARRVWNHPVIKNGGKSRAGRETHISYVHVVFVSWVHMSIKVGKKFFR